MPKPLKSELFAGSRHATCWINLFSPLASEIVAQAGYDSMMIDCEHGPGSVMDVITVMQATQGSGCAPVVRVPSNDMDWIKRVLDAGAMGVMVPNVNSKTEAEAAVAACKYPPLGKRGMAATIIRASGYGKDWRSYAENSNDEILVICQIESGAAVDAVEEIAAVEGVDMLFIGPFDLSASVGYLGQPDHPEVLALIERVEAAAKAAGKLLGTIPSEARPSELLYEKGYQMVVADCDVLLLRDAAQSSCAALKKAAK